MFVRGISPSLFGALVALLALGALAACSNDSVAVDAGRRTDAGGGGVDAGAPLTDVPLTRFGEEMSAASCNLIFRCCDAAERMSMSTTHADEGACATATASDGEQFEATIDSAVQAMAIQYSSTMMAQCINDIRGMSCAAIAAATVGGGGLGVLMLPSCLAALQGQIVDGMDCDNNSLECVSGFCSGGTPTGICQTPAGQGQTCNGACATGLYCDTTTTCIPRLAIGQQCASASECLSNNCDSTNMCVAPFCDGA